MMEMAARGFVTYNGFPWGTNVAILTSQTEVYMKLFLPQTRNVLSGAAINISTGGSTLTGSQSLITVYSAAGTLLTQTADQSGNWTTTGNKYQSFTTAVATTDPFVYVGVLSNGTTPPTLRAVGQNQAFASIGPGADLTTTALLWGRIGTGVTAPASIAPTSIVQTGTFPYWIGLY